jgi:hypothetical protein
VGVILRLPKMVSLEETSQILLRYNVKHGNGLLTFHVLVAPWSLRYVTSAWSRSRYNSSVVNGEIEDSLSVGVLKSY